MMQVLKFLIVAPLVAACVSEGGAQRAIAVTPATPSAGVTAEAKRLAAYNLKDPASAQFRNLSAYRLDTGQWSFCGEINARNSLGGYVGFTPFYVRFNSGDRRPDHTAFDLLAVVECGNARRGETRFRVRPTDLSAG